MKPKPGNVDHCTHVELNQPLYKMITFPPNSTKTIVKDLTHFRNSFAKSIHDEIPDQNINLSKYKYLLCFYIPTGIYSFFFFTFSKVNLLIAIIPLLIYTENPSI